MTVFTYVITGAPFVITKDMQIYRCSFKARGASITMLGNATLQQTDGTVLTSTPITFVDGQGDTLSAFPQAPIDGVTLDPGAGSIDFEVFNN